MVPESSLRRGTAIFVIAITRCADPTQRIIVSYQIPMLSTLLPLSAMFWRQCSASPMSAKRACWVACSSTVSTSPT